MSLLVRYGGLTADMVPDIAEAGEFLPDHEFEFRAYDSLKEMQDYIKGSDYIFKEEIPGVCFGFQLSESESKYEVNMFYNDGPYI